MNQPEPAPINAEFSEVERWLKARGPEAYGLVGSLAYAPTFSAQSFPEGADEVTSLWTTGGWVSWLGGPAVAPLDAWPVSADGLPLMHVMTVSLEDLDGASEPRAKTGWPIHDEGLPTEGVLEVFHDLQTFGHEAADGAARAWLVRWTPAPNRMRLIDGPDTSSLDGYPSRPVCQAGTFLPGWSMPPVADYTQAASGLFDVAHAIRDDYCRAWALQYQAPPGHAPNYVTHAYGHAQHASATANKVLSAVLPLEGDDRYRLLLDIDSCSALSGWFGDLGNLEVWMRQSDLGARNFDAAWCLVRTD